MSIELGLGEKKTKTKTKNVTLPLVLKARIYLLNTYLLSSSLVPSTVLGTKNSVKDRKDRITGLMRLVFW